MKAKNYAARKKAANWIVILIIFVVAVLMLIPFLWMISTSLRPASESMKLPPSFLPTQFEYGNYLELFQSSIPFLNLFGNSIFVTVIVTAAQLITCSTAAYSFARLNFPGRNIIFGILLCTLMVPIQVTIIPLFIGMSSVNLTDTLLSIILPYLTSIFGIFLMRQFLSPCPKSWRILRKLTERDRIGLSFLLSFRRRAPLFPLWESSPLITAGTTTLLP